MNLHEFSTHDEYVAAQQLLTRIKVSGRKTYNCFTSLRVIAAIHQHQPTPVQCLCHGVRGGKELDLFESVFQCGVWMGTEITPELCDGQRIVHWDFTQEHPDWVGRFDLIYSNSFDHARDPEVTAKLWRQQLTPAGRMYIEWTPWHNRLGRRYTADCFAADAQEYYGLLSWIGRVETVLTIPEEGWDRKVFVVQ